jgi:hypothetical protein
VVCGKEAVNSEEQQQQQQQQEGVIHRARVVVC